MLVGYVPGNRLYCTLSRAGVMTLIAGLLAANGSLLALRPLSLLRAD